MAAATHFSRKAAGAAPFTLEGTRTARSSSRRPDARHHAVKLTKIAAMLLLITEGNAYAACNGSIASPVSAAITIQCNGNGTAGDLNNATALVDGTTTATAGNNTLLQFDGQGRTLDNSGSIINNRVITGTAGARGRTAILMGANTQNAALFGTTAPAANASTLNTPNATAAWIGQTIIVGRFDSVEGDMFNGNVRIITGVSGSGANATVTLDSPLDAGFDPGSGLGDQIRFKVIANYGAVSSANADYSNVVKNSGTISSSILKPEIIGNHTGTTSLTSVSYTATVKAITTTVEGDYLINNAAGGTISVKHDGIGSALAIEEGGTVTRLTVNNAGTVSAERTAHLTLAAVTSGANPTATSSDFASFSAQAVANVNAVNTQEEAELLIVNNTGTIRAMGDYTGTINMRAASKQIFNSNLIEHVSSAGGTDYSKGFAIGSVSDGGGIRELDLTNAATGVIHGDILAVNGNALRWYLLSTAGDSTGGALGTNAAMAKGFDSRLTINNQFGQENSEISNAGTIIGNIWLSNGEHELENKPTGRITGNIDVDQRDTTSGTPTGTTIIVLAGGDDDDEAAAASNNTRQGTGFVIRGAKEFEFENAGIFTGNIKITNASSAFSGLFNGTTISGTASSDNSITNSGIFDGNIVVADVAGARNEITLIGDGFGRRADGTVNPATGNISATTGDGNNILNLVGIGTLRGSVAKFTTLNVGAADAGGDSGGDDDDGPKPAATVWTLASGTTQEFTDSATINTGSVLIVDSTLKTPAVNVLVGATLMGGGTIDGSINNGGIIDLRTVNGSGQLVKSTLTVTGKVDLLAGSILKTTITGNGATSADGATANTNASLLKVGVTGTLESGAVIVPVQETPGLVRNGDWYRVATNTSGGRVFDALPAVQNSALINWTVQENANQDLVIGATVRNAATVSGISSGGASTLNVLNGYTGSNPTLLNLISAVQNLQTDKQVRKAAEQLRPEAHGGTSQVALSINNRVNTVIDQRVAETNLASAYGMSGVSTGEGGSGRAGWVQGFGFYGTQDQRNGVDGYTASTAGIALGADTVVGAGDTTRIGVALSYASSKIDDDGINDGNTVKVDSYAATLYGSYAMPKWYLNGSVGIGMHKYDSSRFITVGALRDAATASHDGTQYSTKVEGGLPMPMGKNMLVPIASLTYSHLDQGAYTERSNAGTALAVDKSRTDSIRSGLGAKMLFDVSEPDTRMTFELHAIWLHEFGDTSQDTTAKFAAGGTSFTTRGVDIGRDSANLGLGMRFNSADSRQQIVIGYDAEIRDAYIGHTFMLQARQEF